MSEPVSLGLDLGTSELKAVLLDVAGTVLGHAGTALSVSRPQDGWSEQDPEEWWRACSTVLHQLRSAHSAAYARIRCIGLSGQMHGAVLLDAQNRCIRPAILWNDSRSSVEAALLARAYPSYSAIVGSLPMAGFTAPKLMWLKVHEPAAFSAVDCVMLPKDFLRLRLTGDRATEMSDAAGTLWLDVRNRGWFDPMIEATGLRRRQMPRLVEGSEPTGVVLASVAQEYGLSAGVVVAGGGADNPASGVGIGAIDPGDAFISLGTSATVVATTNIPVGNPTAGVHGLCHSLPDRWYAMGVILSGATCLQWLTSLASLSSEQALLDLTAKQVPLDRPPPLAPLFLPYLSGDRTPHNDPLARGGFMNLGIETSVEMLGYAVLEGVGFALRDAINAVESTGTTLSNCALVGGGARSEYWGQLLANILGLELHTLSGSELGACIGAAKLGFLALGHGQELLRRGVSAKLWFTADRAQHEALQVRYEKFRGLFASVQNLHSGTPISGGQTLERPPPSSR
jgi:xylulokinase